MKLHEIQKHVVNKEHFRHLQNYFDFALTFLDYIEHYRQAEIVSRNESNYRFYQYGKDADYKITRPFNANLLYSIAQFDRKVVEFYEAIKQIYEYQDRAAISDPHLFNRVIYTTQQCIGFALDSGVLNTNQARKLHGDLFEHCIKLVVNDIGIACQSGVLTVPIVVEEEKLFNMQYQHDIIVKDTQNDEIQLIASVKTTSKDRIDKIFVDKFMFSRLLGREIPFIAIFLHDVQRKGKEPNYGINTTFLSGRFKGYTLKLNALNGVYYLDPRPNMLTDEFLKQHIHTFDCLLCRDIWAFVK